MLPLDKLDKHRQLETVTLRYEHAREIVSYEWSARDGKPSDCWMTKEGHVYLPAGLASLLLTELFHHEVVWSPREQKIRYIRIKQSKDGDSRGAGKMVIIVDGKAALAGEEHQLVMA
ncbi:hypothetical protein V2A60_008765 [Cordyceps javanica]